MEKTVRNAMPTIEKVPFVSREKPGPHPFSKYSFSNITEKIGHIITCSQPVDWTDSMSDQSDLFPSEVVILQHPKAFRWPSLDFLFKRQKSEMAIEHSSNPLSSLYTGLLIQVPRPIRGPKISKKNR